MSWHSNIPPRALVCDRTPTGRSRHRVLRRFLLRPLLVLQHEFRYSGWEDGPAGGPFDFTLWEDAEPYRPRAFDSWATIPQKPTPPEH